MRPHDWPERLTDYLGATAGTPFAWGTHDCATFAAGWIETLTGVRPALPVYEDARSYALLAADAGGLQALVERALGAPMANPTEAMRGDVALVETGGRLCLGIVVGVHVAGPSNVGWLLEPRTAIRAAWSV